MSSITNATINGISSTGRATAASARASARGATASGRQISKLPEFVSNSVAKAAHVSAEGLTYAGQQVNVSSNPFAPECHDRWGGATVVSVQALEKSTGSMTGSATQSMAVTQGSPGSTTDIAQCSVESSYALPGMTTNSAQKSSQVSTEISRSTTECVSNSDATTLLTEGSLNSLHESLRVVPRTTTDSARVFADSSFDCTDSVRTVSNHSSQDNGLGSTCSSTSVVSAYGNAEDQRTLRAVEQILQQHDSVIEGELGWALLRYQREEGYQISSQSSPCLFIALAQIKKLSGNTESKMRQLKNIIYTRGTLSPFLGALMSGAEARKRLIASIEKELSAVRIPSAPRVSKIIRKKSV
ncbi:MAG: hypothetical protein HY861_02380 [Chlamydiia bacterium]|nr:hypothetical protein [Chlamydiia bacterium]